LTLPDNARLYDDVMKWYAESLCDMLALLWEYGRRV